MLSLTISYQHPLHTILELDFKRINNRFQNETFYFSNINQAVGNKTNCSKKTSKKKDIYHCLMIEIEASY